MAMILTGLMTETEVCHFCSLESIRALQRKIFGDDTQRIQC
jgi:hypothetical protein